MSDAWRDPGRVAEYLSREIPHRDVAEAMLLDALPLDMGRFIDLGTGNGRLIGLVRERCQDARALGIDFSEPMLAQAGERFAGDPLVQLQRHDLSQPLQRKRRSTRSSLRLRSIIWRMTASKPCSAKLTRC